MNGQSPGCQESECVDLSMNESSPLPQHVTCADGKVTSIKVSAGMKK